MTLTDDQRTLKTEALRIWRANHEHDSRIISVYAARDYAYGVIDYRLGLRKTLPSGGFYVSYGATGEREARKLIRAQIDAILAELKR